MTLRTRGRESARDVVRILCAIEVLLVTSNAGAWCALELPSKVTGSAVEVCVCAGQLKARQFEVIEFCALPRIQRGVALLTCCRETHRPVIRRGGIHVGAHMTADAFCRQPLEPSHGCSLVARLALQGSVRTDQRKTVFVVTYLIDRRRPPVNGVAALAPGSHVAAMDVGVTVTALPPHITEHRFQMALGASDGLMHSAKGRAGFVVIELRHLANRSPSAKGVAVLARDVQRAVRTSSIWSGVACSCRFLLLLRGSQCRQEGQRHRREEQ